MQIKVGELGLQPKPIIFLVNGVEFEYPPQETIITFRGRPVPEDEPLRDGLELRVDGYKQMPILSDLLPYVKIPDPIHPGSLLKLSVNGQAAEFTSGFTPR